MDGIHDLGGFHGMGGIVADPDEPAFHEQWERITFGALVASATAGYWTTDECRHAIERMPAAEYLTTSYYEHWLTAMETLFFEKGVFTREEHQSALSAVRARRHAGTAAANKALPAHSESVPVELWSAVEDVINNGGPASREVGRSPSFAIGQRVRARRNTHRGHTRLTRYVRGRVGEIVLSHGAFVFPDTAAQGRGEEAPQHVYGVRFDGVELWGAEAERGTSVTIDLWESYLEALELGDLAEEPSANYDGRPRAGSSTDVDECSES